MNINSNYAAIPFNLPPQDTMVINPQGHPFRTALSNARNAAMAEKWYAAINNDIGTKVFDLSKLKGNLNNTLLSNDVKMFYDDFGSTIFRAFFKKPNSNEPMIVDIQVPNYKFKEGISEELFNNTIGKAIQLIDKNISIKHSLGDRIADDYGAGFQFKTSTKELDFKSTVDSIKNSWRYRANGCVNGSSPMWGAPVSKATLDKIMQELDDLLLNLGIKV